MTTHPLQHATVEDAPTLYRLATTHYKSIFPYLRADKLRRHCANDTCIWHDGVVITYTVYQKAVRLGTFVAPRGSFGLQELFKIPDAAPGAASAVFRIFLEQYVPTTAWTVGTTRADNTRIHAYYTRNGFTCVSPIMWQEQGRPLPGFVWARAPRVEPSAVALW